MMMSLLYFHGVLRTSGNIVLHYRLIYTSKVHVTIYSIQFSHTYSVYIFRLGYFILNHFENWFGPFHTPAENFIFYSYSKVVRLWNHVQMPFGNRAFGAANLKKKLAKPSTWHLALIATLRLILTMLQAMPNLKKLALAINYNMIFEVHVKHVYFLVLHFAQFCPLPSNLYYMLGNLVPCC